MLRDVFGFVRHQEKTTYGFGYKLALSKKSNNSVLIKDSATINAKTKTKSNERYVPKHTTSIP